MRTSEKFPFQTSFGSFTICKGQSNNSVDVFFNEKRIITLSMVNIWDKDGINHQISRQKENIMATLAMLADNENVSAWKEKAKKLESENKELVAKLEKGTTIKITVNKNNVEEVFIQCLNLMAETYNEKGFTMSRGNSVLNKYKEHK